MSTESTDSDGNVRIVEDDGRKSTLYEPEDGGLVDYARGHGEPIEVEEHHPDGTNEAFEPGDLGFIDYARGHGDAKE